MNRSSYNRHRVFAGLLFILIAFSAVNYYFGLGFFGRGAKGVLLLVLGVILIYGGFFAPTRQDMREHGNTEREP